MNYCENFQYFIYFCKTKNQIFFRMETHDKLLEIRECLYTLNALITRERNFW